MKAKRLWLILPLLVALFGAQCKKEIEEVKEIPEGFIEAVITKAGWPQKSSCGFLVKINDKYYAPINLPENYMVEKKTVWIKYESLKVDFICGDETSYIGYEKIEIVEIKNK